MAHRFGKPQPAPPYSSAGEFKSEPCVLSLETRIKVVVRVPVDQANVDGELSPDFEPKVRQAIADALVGVESEGFVVLYGAVEQFEDAGG